jgi:hypothetical protein
MSKSNESYQKGFVIFFIIAIVITLVVVFILRANATKSGTYLTTLSSKELETEGYGTYSVVNTSPCFTANGKCSGNGVQTVTSYCTPNPTTGYGCIDENGEQTFAPKTTTQNCLPNCRNTILQEQTNAYLNTCQYEQPYGDLNTALTLQTFTPTLIGISGNSITKYDNGSPTTTPGNASSVQKYNSPILQFQLPVNINYPREIFIESLEGNQFKFIINYLDSEPGTYRIFTKIGVDTKFIPLLTDPPYDCSDDDVFSISISNNIINFIQNDKIYYSTLAAGTFFQAIFNLFGVITPGNTSTFDIVDNISFGNNGSEYLCIPRTAKTYNYRIFNCVVNDGVGENACSYTCGSDGRNNANVSGDSIPTSPSFIPACVGKKGQVITLNSLAGINLANLPKQGFKISKGYTVKNKLDVLGAIVPNMFTIDPPYYAPPTENLPIPIGNTEITRDELTAIDNSLIVYENCAIPSARTKPFCANYYYYQGTDVDSQITLINNNVLADSTSNFIFSKDCFNNPFWNVSSTKYLNPYNTTSSKYSLKGVGGFGLTYENYVCRNTPGNLEQVPGTGTPIDTNPPQYYIPGALGGPDERNYCTAFTDSSVEPPVNNTSCYDTLENINTLPLSQNKFYNICDVTYPDGSHPNDWQPNLKTPGLIQMCQYLPTQDQLDFDTFSESVNINLRPFFGNFVQLTITDSGKTYFLGTRTSPCESTVSSNNLSPLTNCSYIKPLGTSYDINRATFIYDGGNTTVSEAGNFWNKPGCDSEMIQLTSALNILISPFETTIVSAPVGNKQTISANLYAYFGNIFGILLQNPFDGSLYFQPIQQADTNKVNYKPSYNQYFNIEFDYSNVNAITMKVLVPTTNVAKFDGNVYSNVGFNITTTSMNTRIIPYNEYIKQSGLYTGQNVTVAASFQRNFACYTTTCDPKTDTFPCFPNTCNLYYNYNADKC